MSEWWKDRVKKRNFGRLAVDTNRYRVTLTYTAYSQEISKYT
jgi:hypothetical protein